MILPNGILIVHFASPASLMPLKNHLLLEQMKPKKKNYFNSGGFWTAIFISAQYQPKERISHHYGPNK